MPKDRRDLIRRARRTVAVGLGVSALFVAYSVGLARAGGLAPPTVLTYSGQLLTFGGPDNSTHTMSVALYSGTTQECITPNASVTCVNGQFSIPLASTPACLTAIETFSGLDAQVTIDGTPMGMEPITAVPYAVVANNAVGALTPQSVTVNGGPVALSSSGLTLGTNSLDLVTAAPWELLTGGAASNASSLHTHTNATDSIAGMMSAADKTKLDEMTSMVSSGGQALKIYSGTTPYGNTPWAQNGSTGLYITVNTAAAGFTTTPLYFTSLRGDSGNWQTSGATSIYGATSTAFTVYLYYIPGAISPANANSWGWSIQWMAIGY